MFELTSFLFAKLTCKACVNDLFSPMFSPMGSQRCFNILSVIRGEMWSLACFSLINYSQSLISGWMRKSATIRFETNSVFWSERIRYLFRLWHQSGSWNEIFVPFQKLTFNYCLLAATTFFNSQLKGFRRRQKLRKQTHTKWLSLSMSLSHNHLQSLQCSKHKTLYLNIAFISHPASLTFSLSYIV